MGRARATLGLGTGCCPHRLSTLGKVPLPQALPPQPATGRKDDSEVLQCALLPQCLLAPGTRCRAWAQGGSSPAQRAGH